MPASRSPTGKPAVFLGAEVTEGPDGLAWVDLDGRKIDFRMVDEGGEASLVARARRDKFGDADKRSGPLAELDAVTQADRALKAEAKRRTGAGKGVHPVRAAKSAARKGASAQSPKRR